MNPMICSRGVVARPSATMAPTSTIPWMKFEPLISGVWRMTGTRLMTTSPVKAASITM